MRISVFIVFMTMTMGVYAQKYKVGTTTALWKVPALYFCAYKPIVIAINKIKTGTLIIAYF